MCPILLLASTTDVGVIRLQEENKTEEVAALGKCINYFSDQVNGHWLGQKGLKIDMNRYKSIYTLFEKKRKIFEAAFLLEKIVWVF